MCVLNTLSEYTYFLHTQKRLLQTPLLLGSKIVESLNVSLSQTLYTYFPKQISTKSQ